MARRRESVQWPWCVATALGWVFIIMLLVMPPDVALNGPLGFLFSLLLGPAPDGKSESIVDIAIGLLPSPEELAANPSKPSNQGREKSGSIGVSPGGLRGSPKVSKGSSPVIANGKKSVPARIDPGYFELVVAWYCEDEKWFVDFEGSISVYSKKFHCTNRLKRKLANRSKQKGPVFVRDLPNVGREGHTYIKHILDNWDTLATYTAFTQGAGHHNGVSAMARVREFLKDKLEKHLLVPIVHTNEKGPLLYRDADRGDEFANGGLDKKANLHIFRYVSDLDMAGRARELYASLFGVEACTAPPMIFIAGAQMIVHRKAIRAKPKSFWKHIYKALADCHPYGWDFERLWVYAFDVNVIPLGDPKLPSFCKGTFVASKDDCQGKFNKAQQPWELPVISS
eukprot:TRINITY_DN7838_c0_g1_i2.p1 TRINITY_DN7838_c0_g1~~TRINITY_DN7838_c0_g1_i2.p1  ORF type:complete len:397 (-),score=40.26 TRINITY_DN7838_c0_g1_i2:393-1583(-)